MAHKLWFTILHMQVLCLVLIISDPGSLCCSHSGQDILSWSINHLGIYTPEQDTFFLLARPTRTTITVTSWPPPSTFSFCQFFKRWITGHTLRNNYGDLSFEAESSNKYKKKFVIEQSLWIIVIKSKKTKMVTDIIVPTRLSAGIDDHSCFLTFIIIMVPIDSKITNFSLYLSFQM